MREVPTIWILGRRTDEPIRSAGGSRSRIGGQSNPDSPPDKTIHPATKQEEDRTVQACQKRQLQQLLVERDLGAHSHFLIPCSYIEQARTATVRGQPRQRGIDPITRCCSPPELELSTVHSHTGHRPPPRFPATFRPSS